MPKAKNLVAAINDPLFLDLLRRTSEKLVNYDEFSKFPMPKGYGPEEMWVAKMAIQRSMGYEVGSFDYFKSDRGSCWVYIPKNYAAKIRRIASLCSADSALSVYLADATNRRNLLPFIFDEVTSLARRDGLDIGQDRIRQLWTHAISPQTPEDCIIANLVSIFDEFTRFQKIDLSISLIEMIHGILIEGVGELPSLKRQRTYSEGLYNERIISDRSFAVESIENVIKCCGSAETSVHPLLYILQISTILWDMSMFPSFNALTELPIRCIFFSQHGMTPLSYVPFSNLSTELGKSSFSNYEENYKVVDRIPDNRLGNDTTLVVSAQIDLFLSGLLKIMDTVNRAQLEEQRLSEVIRGLPKLNRRQRSFLISTRGNTDEEYGIGDYISQSGASYGTAHKDLFDLVDLGYMTMHKSSGAFVFQLLPGAIPKS